MTTSDGATAAIENIYKHIKSDRKAAEYYSPVLVSLAMHWGKIYDKDEPFTDVVPANPASQDAYFKRIYEHIKAEPGVVFYYEPETVKMALRWGQLYYIEE